MHPLSTYQAWYGVDRPPSTTYELNAGPLTMLLDGIDLRYVRSGSLEMVRRIYVAVRDQNWNTIAGQSTITRIAQQQDSFDVEFDVEHKNNDIDFTWHGHIIGDPDGQIRYEMDGLAKSKFRYNRIGLCILHPFKESLGRLYKAQTPQGEVSGYLPDLIGPQGFEDGVYVPLFPAFNRLSIDLTDTARAHFTFEGDLFETEDQRNWTDASLKTYCTPLSRGFPHQANIGSRIAQTFTIAVEGGEARAQEQKTGVTYLTLGTGHGQRLPHIGFSTNSEGPAPNSREIARLLALQPDHLRVEVHLNTTYMSALDHAIKTCQGLHCMLEVALFLNTGMEEQLATLATHLQKSAVKVIRILVFQEGAQTAHPEETTAPELVRLARQYLQQAVPDAAFAGGTDMYFCELNRTRPHVEAMDAISYTIIPQEHAFDERSLAETLEAQGETVRSGRAFADGHPIVISPITLKQRYNPHAIVAETEKALNELPDSVDPRQLSLFGAAWTAGSIKYLTESGAASLTYYELLGWRGLLERETGSPLPALFPSTSGMIFPLYHIFADIAECKNYTIVPCRSDQPLTAAALVLSSEGEHLHMLIFNLKADQQRVVIGPLHARSLSLRKLDEQSIQEAILTPDTFRQHRQQVETQAGELVLDLAPYAIIRIDA